MAKRLRPLSQSHFTVTMAGFSDLTFTEFSGINETTDSTRFADGQRRRMYTINGMTSVDDVTIATPYDPENHDALISKLRELKNKNEAVTITITPTTDDEEMKARGKAFVLNGCLFKGIKVAQVNRTSSDASKLELVFSVDEFTKA